MEKQIFIGGTGRSGTSVMSKYLGDHEEICQIPKETKLLVNKGGMIDVYNDLSKHFSLTRGRTAVAMFENLISDMRNRYTSPYISYDLDQLFGSHELDMAMQEFITSVTNGSYIAWEIDVKEKFHKIKYLQRLLYFNFSRLLRVFLNKKTKVFARYSGNKVLKRITEKNKHHSTIYFQNEEEILNIIRKFVDSLFLSYAKKRSKAHWCEATPENIMYADFLAKLYPDAYFIHMVRHPVGVIYSWMQRSWGPSNIETACKYLSSGYDRMIYIDKISKIKNINLSTIKLEDICNEEKRLDVLSFLGLSRKNDSNLSLEIEKVNHWKNIINEKDLKLIESYMKKYIEYYNYESV